MGVEQEHRGLAGVEIGLLSDCRKWRCLIGRCATLSRRHDMARLAPSMSKPFAVARIGGKCRRRWNDHGRYQTLSDTAKHFKLVHHLQNLDRLDVSVATGPELSRAQALFGVVIFAQHLAGCRVHK